MRLQAIFIIFWSFGSCDVSTTGSDAHSNSGVNRERIKSYGTIEQSVHNTLNQGLRDFAAIQKELSHITRNHRIIYTSIESRDIKRTRGQRILDDIRNLDDYLTEIENKLTQAESELSEARSRLSEAEGRHRDESGIIRYLRQIISSHRDQLADFEQEIKALKEANYSLILTNEDLKKTVENQKSIISAQEFEINKKYCLLVHKRAAALREITTGTIRFDCKLKDKKILSDHPSNSFDIYDDRVLITNWDSFWSHSNFLIIRENRGRCGFIN